jgi:hypothetical protein
MVRCILAVYGDRAFDQAHLDSPKSRLQAWDAVCDNAWFDVVYADPTPVALTSLPVPRAGVRRIMGSAPTRIVSSGSRDLGREGWCID